MGSWQMPDAVPSTADSSKVGVQVAVAAALVTMPVPQSPTHGCKEGHWASGKQCQQTLTIHSHPKVTVCCSCSGMYRPEGQAEVVTEGHSTERNDIISDRSLIAGEPPVRLPLSCASGQKRADPLLRTPEMDSLDRLVANGVNLCLSCVGRSYKSI